MKSKTVLHQLAPTLLMLAAMTISGYSGANENVVLHNGRLVVNGEQVFLKIGKPLRNFANAEACQQLTNDLDTLKAKGFNALELNCYWHHFDHNGDGRIDESLKPLSDLIEAIHAKQMFPCLSVETYGVGGGQIPKGFWAKHPKAVAIDSNSNPVKDDEYGFNATVPSLFYKGYLEASRRFIRELTRGVPHSKILYFETTVEPQFMGRHDVGYSDAAKHAYQAWLGKEELAGPAWPESFPVPESFRKDPVWLRFRAESLADWVNKDAQAFRSVAGEKAYIAVDYLETCGPEMYKRNGNSIQFLTALTCADIIQVNWSWHLGKREPNSGAYANVENVMKETGRAWAVSEHMTLNGSDFRPDEVARILTNAIENGTGFGFEFVNIANSTKDPFSLYNDDWSPKPLMAEVDDTWNDWQKMISVRFSKVDQ